MKPFSLPSCMLAGLMITSAVASKAQYISLVEPKLLVNSPASIAGGKNFTWSMEGASGWGRDIDSFWYNQPLVRAQDSLACGQLTNGAAVNGKWALVFRGDCEFGAKALNAQNAGAKGVIIVNNIPGGPVAMGAGAVGSQVTIPVLMVSQADGNAMNDQLRGGTPVYISITNWGFGFTHDLTFVPGSAPMGPNYATPLAQMSSGNPAPYRFYTGGFVANVGTSNETNVKVKATTTFTPTGSSTPLVVHRDSSTIATFNTLDSVNQTFTATGFNHNPTTTGRYEINYELSAANADQNPADNEMSVEMLVTDSIFSKARYDLALGRPTVTVGYRFANAGPMTWGPLYYVNAGNYQARKIQFTISDGNTGTSLDGTTPISVYIYKWTDGVVANDKIMQSGELSVVGLATKNFSALDSNYQMWTVNVTDPFNPNKAVVLDANSWYWVAAETNGNVYLGCDGNMNYMTRAYAADQAVTPPARDYWAPIFGGQNGDLQGAPNLDLTMYPFSAAANNDSVQNISFAGAKGLVPAIALHLAKNPGTSVENVAANPFAEATLYPNPASAVVNLKLKLQDPAAKVYFKITDAFGRVLHTEVKQNIQNSDLQFNTSNLSAGVYYMVITTDKGISTMRPFTVVGK